MMYENIGEGVDSEAEDKEEDKDSDRDDNRRCHKVKVALEDKLSFLK